MMPKRRERWSSKSHFTSPKKSVRLPTHFRVSLPFFSSVLHSVPFLSLCSRSFIPIPQGLCLIRSRGGAAAAILLRKWNVYSGIEGGFDSVVVVFGTPKPEPKSSQGGHSAASRVRGYSEPHRPAMPHLDFHDHREKRETPADFHDFAHDERL